MKSFKNPYIIYYPHSLYTVDNQIESYHQIVSIDPGIKNYAIRIEKRVNETVTTIVMDKFSIETDNIICKTYQMLTDFLNKYKEFYDYCDLIIIEKQLPKNYKAVRISQHTITYFSIYLLNKPLLPIIIELDPKIKNKVLNIPKNIKSKQLKIWSVNKAKELLIQRNDYNGIKILNNFKKQDDLSDTICQIEAFFLYLKLLNIKQPRQLLN